jgi:hypothetical protein
MRIDRGSSQGYCRAGCGVAHEATSRIGMRRTLKRMLIMERSSNGKRSVASPRRGISASAQIYAAGSSTETRC